MFLPEGPVVDTTNRERLQLITRDNGKSLSKSNQHVHIFSTVILASHSLLQFVAFWCRSAFIVASDWFVLPI